MDKQGINIVITADGPYKGMKMYGPRLLIKYKNVSILDYMLTSFSTVFQKYDLYVISNFKIKKPGIKVLPRNLFIEDIQNVSKNFRYLNTMLIFEDTIPNQNSLKAIKANGNTSSMVFDSNNELSKHDMGGVLGKGNMVQHLSYGLDVRTVNMQKWSNILYLNQGGMDAIYNIIADPDNRFMMNFEIINQILDRGQPIMGISGKKIKTMNITTPSDIVKVRYII